MGFIVCVPLTHTAHETFSLALLLEFLGGSVTQSRVQSLSIVILLDELPDVRSQVLQILVLVRIDFFALHRLDEAFAAPPDRERLMFSMSQFGRFFRIRG